MDPPGLNALVLGVEQGNFHIANDMTVNIVRAATRGASPMNTVILDTVYEILGWVRLTLCALSSANPRHRCLSLFTELAVMTLLSVSE